MQVLQPSLDMKTLQAGDFTVLVGESAQENWDLIDQARKQGWFFHLTDFPSPYVVLECGKVEPNAHIKLRCAELCVEHSKQRNSGKVKVDVTPVSNVKVDKKDMLGECDYKNEGKVEILVVETGKKADGKSAESARDAEDTGSSRSKDRGGRGSKGYATSTPEQIATMSGEYVSIRKSPAGGRATITFIKSPCCETRNAVLREHAESGIAVKSGVIVQLQPQVDPKTKEEVPSEIFASWGRITKGRKDEEHVALSEAELIRCFDELARRASVAVARAAPSRAQGARVEVRKAAAGGVAVVSFQDAELRNAVLESTKEITLDNGVLVKLQPQKDPKTKEEVPTDIFAAWGRKIEEKSPVSETEMLSCIEKLCDTVLPAAPVDSAKADADSEAAGPQSES